MIHIILIFCIPLNSHAVSKVDPQNDSIDTANRLVIQNYIGKAINAHVIRDKKMLAAFWSVAVRDSFQWRCGTYYRYGKYQVQTYWDKTYSKVFKSDKHVRAIAKDVNIVQHPLIKWVYGVTIYLMIEGKRFSDSGYMFLVWDFRNSDAPQIHIRTWQPEYVDKDKGQKLNPNDVYSLADFDL